MIGLDDALATGANPAGAFQFHPTPRQVHGLKAGLCGLAGAAFLAARHPAQHVDLAIPDTASAARVEIARAFAPDAPTVDRANADAKQVSNLMAV